MKFNMTAEPAMTLKATSSAFSDRIPLCSVNVLGWLFPCPLKISEWLILDPVGVDWLITVPMVAADWLLFNGSLSTFYVSSTLLFRVNGLSRSVWHIILLNISLLEGLAFYMF